MMTFYAILNARTLFSPGFTYTQVDWCGRTNRTHTAELLAFEGAYELWEVHASGIKEARRKLDNVVGTYPVTIEAIWRDNTSTQDVARAEAGVRLHAAAQPHCCHGRPMDGPRCPECMERVQHTSDCAWDGFRSVRK